jgi:hypothetical protein
MKKRDKIEVIVIALCGIFAVTMALYHILGTDFLRRVWIFTDNGLPLVMSLFISYVTVGFLKIFFRWVLPPYFITKLIYHFSCVTGFYIMSPQLWELLWSIIAVDVLVTGLIFCIIKYIRNG